MAEEAPNNIVSLTQRRKEAEKGLKIRDRKDLSPDGRPISTVAITSGTGIHNSDDNPVIQKAKAHAKKASGVDETNPPSAVRRLFSQTMHSPRLLVVDSNQEEAQAIANTFTPHGFTVERDQSLGNRSGVTLHREGDKASDAIILREDNIEEVKASLNALKYPIPVVVVSNNPDMLKALNTQEIKAHLKAPVGVFNLEGESLEGSAHLALLNQVRAVIATAAKGQSTNRGR